MKCHVITLQADITCQIVFSRIVTRKYRLFRGGELNFLLFFGNDFPRLTSTVHNSDDTSSTNKAENLTYFVIPALF